MTRTLSLALTVAALVSLSGCGGEELLTGSTTEAALAGDPAQALADALAATVAAGSARVTVTLGAGEEEPPLLRADGLVDFAESTSSLSTHLPDDVGSGPVEQVHAYGSTWLRMPGEQWVEVSGPLDGLTDPLGLDGLIDLGTIGAGDPLAQLTALEGASDVRATGTGEVRGVPTQRYEGVLAAGLLDQAPESLRDRVRSLAGGSLPAVGFTADVDADGRLRRLAPKVDGAATGWATIELGEFGLPVDVRPPDPADVRGELVDELLGELDAQDGGTAATDPMPQVTADDLQLLVDEVLG